jgi:hypothetical protein
LGQCAAKIEDRPNNVANITDRLRITSVFHEIAYSVTKPPISAP